MAEFGCQKLRIFLGQHGRAKPYPIEPHHKPNNHRVSNEAERVLQIKNVAGAASWLLLHCYKCHHSIASSYEQDFRFSWSVWLKCPTCESSWWICTKCANLRSHLKTPAQATRHNRMKHKHDTTVATTTLAPAPDATETIELEPIKDTYFGYNASVLYFEACKKGDGVHQLVG